MKKAKAILIKDRFRVRRKGPKRYPKTEPIVLGPFTLSKQDQELVRMPLLLAAKLISER